VERAAAAHLQFHIFFLQSRLKFRYVLKKRFLVA
jgi:hypothetical protein